MTPPDYEYLRKILKDHSGLDLSADKQYLIESRLLPLARKCSVPGIGDLVQKIKGGSSLIIAQVVEAMTTNETFFFRDKIPFEHFRDSIMPQLLRALRAMPHGDRPKVVFCTTENDLAHIARAMHAGADEYIMKPFDKEIVEAKFQEVGLL